MIRRMMTYHVTSIGGRWLLDPAESILPWTRLHPIYIRLNRGRHVGMFGMPIT